MRKFAVLLLFLCLPVFAKNTDRQFVKKHISKYFGNKWNRVKLHRVTDGSDNYYDVIQKDSSIYSIKHIAMNNYGQSRYIMAVIEKYKNIGAHCDGTELVFFEWYIDKTTDSIKEQYVQTIDSAGSYGESIAEFRVEKITDTSSIIIYQEEFFGQGIIGKSAHLLFKGKRILFLEDYEVQTSNFDPEDAVDGVDTNMIWTDIFVNPKESTIFINTTDWTDYMKIGEKYNWSEYKLRNNKFVKIKSGDTLR
jgi:hypothetical protein